MSDPNDRTTLLQAVIRANADCITAQLQIAEAEENLKILWPGAKPFREHILALNLRYLEEATQLLLGQVRDEVRENPTQPDLKSAETEAPQTPERH